MIRRARMLSVCAMLLAGALALMSATQVWLVLTIVDDAGATQVDVLGSDALALTAPLALAALALGAALSIVGAVLRFLFGAIAVVIGVPMAAATVALVLDPQSPSYAAAVSAVTGVSGTSAVEALVQQIVVTAWPVVALGAWVFLAFAGVFVLLTARRWQRAGRRYEQQAAPLAQGAALDAVDSWDDLSRGQDPTADGPQHSGSDR